MANCAENQLAILAVRSIMTWLESSSSSSDSDDETLMRLFVRGARVPRLRIHDYIGSVLDQCTDLEFKAHFRMGRATVQFILGEIKDLLEAPEPGKGRPRISAIKQLLVAIWTMATPDSYRSVCEKFDIGRATAIRAVRRVTNVLCSTAQNYIHWPVRPEEVCAEFERKYGFPRVVGAIDGTHITITAPSVDAEAYVNRKGRFSIQLQVICDNSLKFTHCYAGQPGSLHDQRVFRLSEVEGICNNNDNFPNDSHIIGDAAYAIQRRVLVPYKDNGHLSARQRNYNFRLSSCRMVIERAIGLLKGRFRSLLDRLAMTRVDLISNYIIACCVLLNICLLQNDELNIPLMMDVNPIIEANNGPVAATRAEGVEKRRVITNTLEMNNVR